MKKFIYCLLLSISFSAISIAQTVYVTRTGAKYHDSGCRYLSRSCISIALPEAIAAGYEPCSVCAPPTRVARQKTTHKAKSRIRHQPRKQSASKGAQQNIN